MEVTSSTASSTQLEANEHVTQVPTSSTSIMGPTVTTSSGEADEPNNVVPSSEVTSSSSVEAVYYGPALPPSVYSSEAIHYPKDVRDSKAIPGSCGLYNLGNTCFMNSGLQSLMSCSPLVKFFCENYTLTDNNRHTLTAHFFTLLSKIWLGKFSMVYPRKFKEYLGFFHPQFEDYRQHDCQEFLALLLDTLHEQLNTATRNAEFSSSVLAGPSAYATSLAFPGPDADIASKSSGRTVEYDSEAHEMVFNDFHHKSTLLPSSVCEQEVDRLAKSPKMVDLPSSIEGGDVESSLCYPVEESPCTETLTVESSATSPSSQGDDAHYKSPVRAEEEEVISSSFPTLKQYSTKSHLDDVSSSDSGISPRSSLKRVSSANSVSASGLIFTSEDSNHSSVSAHSTDSEQSSALKRLKIDSADLNRNSNNMKDYVTSSSDCRKGNRHRGMGLDERDSQAVLVSSNGSLCGQKALRVIDNMVSSCREEGDSASPQKTFSEVDTVLLEREVTQEDELQPQLSPNLPSLEDFYRKETKTLNTNVLVSDFLQEMTSDSEKFVKVDNRNRPPSKEVNILQEATGEEDKTEKVLIGQRFGVKDTNLYFQSSATAAVKPIRNSDPNILNNCYNNDIGLSMGQVSKFSLGELPETDEVQLKLGTSPGLVSRGKLEEEEKNVQMQAYSKFNTVPICSNIRTDLTDMVADTHNMDVDEVEGESSDDDEVEMPSQASTVGDYSSVPNCLRHCAPSEVVMANSSWEDYLASNDSIVVSTFQGQFRSTVVCSECNHVSVTYEPFMYLSLPIPHAMEQQMCVTYVSCSAPPVKFLLNLLKTDTMGTAKKKLSELVAQDNMRVIMAEVLDSHISRILEDNILLKYVNTSNRKIYALELVSLEQIDLDPDPIEPSVWFPTLNNKEGCSPPKDLQDSHLSNHSLDSVLVNSPSSRDTLDYVLSDSEVCEYGYQELPELLPPAVGCKDEGEESFAFRPHPSGSDNPLRNISDSNTQCLYLHPAPNSEEQSDCVPASSMLEKQTTKPLNPIAACTSVAPASTSSDMLDMGDGCRDSSQHHVSAESRSCPSPEHFFPGERQNLLLMDNVAARLQDKPGSYFLHHSPTNHSFYDADGSYNERSEPSALSDPADQCPVDPNWSSTVNTALKIKDVQTVPLGPGPSAASMHIEWRSCAICLEDLLDTELLTHVTCDGAFCQNCLQMSVKHTADVSAFCCPICLHPANVCEDFVPLATTSSNKSKIRTLPISIAFRHKSESGSLELYGHPNIIHTPNVISGERLYSLIGQLMMSAGAYCDVYTIVLTDGLGVSCSRCPYSSHCTGCEVARDGEMMLHMSDCLAVHVSNVMSPENLKRQLSVTEDISMEGLRSSQPTTIMDCFGAFTQSEVLDEHNPWFCPQCERNQCAKKTMTVWRYPDNLIIHLKRFVYQDLSSTKVDMKVVFPHEGMDVRGFLSGPSHTDLVYDLHSIVCHFGGASSGHYTCFSRHPLTSQWFYYNDETVTQQVPSEAEYSSGYLLFYQRQGTEVEFSPMESIPHLDEDVAEVPVAAAVTSSSSDSHNRHNSMALVLFQGVTGSTPSGDRSKDEDNDYDSHERRDESVCSELSINVHFGSEFPDPYVAPEDKKMSRAGDGQSLHTEPDSTLDFYS